MYIYSFEKNINLTSESGIPIVNLFEKTMTNIPTLGDSTYVTPIEQVCRPDLITDELYNSTSFVEEMLVMNNIINPFAIEQNTEINYTSSDNLSQMYRKDKDTSVGVKQDILNINNSKTSTKRLSLLPPSVNPGIKQIDIDYNKKKITVMNKFK